MISLLSTVLRSAMLFPCAVPQVDTNSSRLQQDNAASIASTYVPIDRWVYSAFERLAAEEYLAGAFFDLRPWTRMSCARMLVEARLLLRRDLEAPDDAASLLRSLDEEFQPELERVAGGRNRELRLESIEVRSTSIGGWPLTDGYHFAKSIVDAPATTRTFLRSIFSIAGGAKQADPGDRRVAVDAQYRIPGLRKCLTSYVDGFSDDQPSPVVYPTESAWLSGFFLRCVPELPRMPLRDEGLSRFPALASTRQRNDAFTVQLSYHPLSRTHL